MKIKKVFYWIFLILGVLSIFRAISDLFIGGNLRMIISSFLFGAIFLLVAKNLKSKIIKLNK